MSAKQLTTIDRQSILDGIMNHRFKGERDAIEERLTSFGDKVYENVFGSTNISLMESLPEGWLKMFKSFEVQISGSVESLKTHDKRPYPADKCHAILGVYDGDHPFAIEYQEIVADLENHQALEASARSQARAVLLSCYSLKALLEVWPEVEPFAQFLRLDRAFNLPAPPIKDLNQLLKLGETK